MFHRKKNKQDPFRGTLLLFLRFLQTQSPNMSRAITIAAIERGGTVRVSAQQLWAEALQVGLPCADDFREAAEEGWIFIVTPTGVETTRM